MFYFNFAITKTSKDSCGRNKNISLFYTKANLEPWHLKHISLLLRSLSFVFFCCFQIKLNNTHPHASFAAKKPDKVIFTQINEIKKTHPFA